MNHFRSSLPTQVYEDNMEVSNQSEDTESAINNTEIPNLPKERKNLVLNEKE